MTINSADNFQVKNFFQKALKFDIDCFCNSLEKNDINTSFMHFFHFLEDLFALREKLGIDSKYSKDKFGILHQFYNSIKHNRMTIDIFKIYEPEYAISFPIEFDNNCGFNLQNCYLTDIQSLKISSVKNKKHPEKNISVEEFYQIFNKELKNKPVTEIMNNILKETYDNTQIKEKKNG